MCTLQVVSLFGITSVVIDVNPLKTNESEVDLDKQKQENKGSALFY